MESKVSFYCYYADGHHCCHRQVLDLDDISLWIYCYKFTHPECTAISCKIWFDEED